MTEKPAKPKAPEPKPGVEVGDDLYVHHQGQPCTGRVAAHGAHGVTVEIGGKHQQVKWAHVLGHKKRAAQRYAVVDQGEDGMLVEDHQGRRRFVGVPNEAKDDPMVVKSMQRAVLLFKAEPSNYAGGPGLQKKQITDKRGVQTTKWVSTKQGAPKQRSKAAPDSGAQAGYGTHNLSNGDTVNFKAGDFEGSGKIVGNPGRDGAHVKDASGRVHQVHWAEITGHDKKGGAEKPSVQHEVRGEQKPVPADKFKAAAFAKAHDDASVSVDSILSNFPPDTSQKIADVQERLKSIEQTIGQFKVDGKYTEERDGLHFKIISSILSPERIKAATPSEGDAPTFTVLGGRGGSGKSWFAGQVYDPDKAIVLDADHIKGMLPEYEGWNAFQIHAESSDIFDEITSMCARLGLNVVHDATLKTTKSAVAKVQSFKDLGYKVEAHYMHLPRQEAAKRAVSRFLGKTQRYVPIDVVLSNTTNEESFDQVKGLADKWSFRDNNVPQGQDPILISESGGGRDGAKEEALNKSDQSSMMLLWKLT